MTARPKLLFDLTWN